MDMKRRSFLQMAAGTTALAGLGDLGFLAQLQPVSAADAKLEPATVRLDSEIEPLVRLLENTPRERVLEEVAARIRRGMTYRELLAALLLAGVRNIEPRPVGFKFHAVLVINSAHLASLSSPDSERWLPIFWAIDQFKKSQAANAKEGGWVLGPVDEAAVPPAHKAREAFIRAMDNWDEAAADAAVVGLARSAGADEIFEILCHYGVRDFYEIGHKQIYVANSFRTLQTIGWQHAEPVLRSLAYALLDREGAKSHTPISDSPDQALFHRNVELVKKIHPEWLGGQVSSAATLDLLQTMRAESGLEVSDKVVELLNSGISPHSIFDALFDGAGELLMRSPGILSLHATTFTNATHYAWQRVRSDETRRLLLLQNAAFMTLYRGNHGPSGIQIDSLEPTPTKASGPGAIEEIFADISADRLAASSKILSYLNQSSDPKPLADAARRLIFLKGHDSHDYKYSSAVLEDYSVMAPPWRDRYLAATAFYLKGSADPDNDLVKRSRAALQG
jgi:hypothetical protein